jgi:hypothetical protein
MAYLFFVNATESRELTWRWIYYAEMTSFDGIDNQT